jgi:2-polyprenyl-3-methyl-5-hydroxy-6-metoxy-1,4-benzoquinol methylase
VDVDEKSLGAARKNLSALPNARVQKVSAYDLDPATLGTFDRVTSIGVVHHLADPQLAVRKMWSCVAPGGELILWCYGKEGNQRILPLIQAARFVGSRLPLPVSHALSKAVAAALWPAFNILPFKTEYYRNLKALSFRNVESIIFDQMIPHIAHYWTESDMRGLLSPLGGELRLEHVQGNSWSARVRK